MTNLTRALRRSLRDVRVRTVRSEIRYPRLQTASGPFLNVRTWAESVEPHALQLRTVGQEKGRQDRLSRGRPPLIIADL